MKIRICGSVGSGKTTLARRLSEKYEIPYYELDQVVWERGGKNGDRRRSESEKVELLKEITDKQDWIIEGVPNEEWTYETFKQADLLCLLDPPKPVIYYRLTRRFLLQKLKLEEVHDQPTFSVYLKMFKWMKMFEEKGKPNVKRLADSLQKQLMVITEPRAISRIEKKLSEQ